MIHSDQLIAAIEHERRSLAHEFLVEPSHLTELVMSNPGQPFIAQADGIAYTSALYSVLNTTKSFLDVYAMLMGKLISKNVSWSFKRGKVGQDEISGGAIINWLIRSAPKDFKNSRQLADVIHRHSKAWITSVVGYRDTTSHYSEIKGFRHLHVPLLPNRPCFREEFVREPTMPDETPLRQYGAYLQTRLLNILQETLPLLPNIDLNEISLEKLFVRA